MIVSTGWLLTVAQILLATHPNPKIVTALMARSHQLADSWLVMNLDRQVAHPHVRDVLGAFTPPPSDPPVRAPGTGTR